MWQRYTLRVGLPQTNFRNLAERQLLMEAGNFFWWALGEAVGQPVSAWHGSTGEPVYATIFFLEERLPADRTLDTFILDDRLDFHVGVRFLSNRGAEGRIVFDRQDRLPVAFDPAAAWDAVGAHPTVHFGSMFARLGPQQVLVLEPPVEFPREGLPQLSMEDHPAGLTRRAQQGGALEVIPPEWPAASEPMEARYTIDPDRDTNATGLAYFASYVSWLELAERQSLGSSAPDRRLLHRRIAYYGNARMSEQVTIAVTKFASCDQDHLMGLRYRVIRSSDAALLCASEAVFAVAPRPAAALRVAVGAGQGIR